MTKQRSGKDLLTGREKNRRLRKVRKRDEELKKVGMRTCITCWQEKLIDPQFPPDRVGRIYHKCKRCYCDYRKDYNARNAKRIDPNGQAAFVHEAMKIFDRDD